MPKNDSVVGETSMTAVDIAMLPPASRKTERLSFESNVRQEYHCPDHRAKKCGSAVAEKQSKAVDHKQSRAESRSLP